MSYVEDRAWADRFLIQIRQLVGAHLCQVAPPEVDTREATDLIVLRAKPWTVACRMRKFNYLEKYGGEFTIRSERENGVRTELAKIVEDGFGDLLFYGFANEIDRDIAFYSILDLQVFRECHARVKFTRKRNRKDRTWLNAYRIRDFPPHFCHPGGGSINGVGQRALFAKIEKIA